jgi:tRNA threonylcarbamoyladenosine biosynthesis protein TsaE
MQGRAFSADELDSVAAGVLDRARKMQGQGAVVLALQGELGAGKTSLVQAIARGLEVRETITSPTFVILKSYETKDGAFKRLVHIDAYRIEDHGELAVLGFEDMLKEAGTLIAVEWPERVSALIPRSALTIALAHEPDGRRSITYAD